LASNVFAPNYFTPRQASNKFFIFQLFTNRRPGELFFSAPKLGTGITTIEFFCKRVEIAFSTKKSSRNAQLREDSPHKNRPQTKTLVFSDVYLVF